MPTNKAPRKKSKGRRGRPPGNRPVHLTRFVGLTEASPTTTIALPSKPRRAAKGNRKAGVSHGSRGSLPFVRDRVPADEHTETLLKAIDELLQTKRARIPRQVAEDILKILLNA